MLSHELRNPLAPMTGALELMKSASDPDTEQTRFTCSSARVGQIVRMVDDLLDISRIGGRKIEPAYNPSGLGHGGGVCARNLPPMIDAAAHRLSVSLPPEPLYLNVDVARLAQVFANLLSNAVKYTPSERNPPHCEPRSDDAVIRVQDSGMGIHPLTCRVSLIFLHRRAEPKPAVGRSGIGLNLVKQLVEMHGGTVQC